jgi:hypothetical protein
LLHSHSKSIAKLEFQIGQLVNALSQREEGKLPSQPMANPKGHYMIDENASNNSRHEQVQAITKLRSGGIINNQVEEKRTEKIGPPETPNMATKGKGMISVVPYSATHPLETQYKPKASFPQRLKKPIGNRDEKLNATHPPPFIDQNLGSQF